MTQLRLSEEHEATDTDRAVVIEGLRSFNLQHMQWADSVPLTLFLRDESGHIRGGLLGVTRWHWLLVDTVWVAEEYRGRGYGRALLERAEVVAQARDCLHTALDTTDFQARGLYEKCGYRVFGELPDYPPGSRTYYMTKTLEAASREV